MKQVSTVEADPILSGVMRDVQQGEAVVVTSDARPAAAIEAYKDSDVAFDAAQKEEARKQLVTRLLSQPLHNLGKFNRADLYEDTE